VKQQKLEVRLARRGDEPALAAMMLELWPDEGRAAFFDKPVGALTRHVNGGPKGFLAVALVAGERVGFVSVGIRPWSEAGGEAPIPHVEGWFVARRSRRRGVGRALLRFAEAWSREKGFRFLSSDTWSHNRRSVRAHQAAGFRVTERIVYLLKRLPLLPRRRGLG